MHRPLPFLYESNGDEIRFTNGLDPKPRSRALFHFHTPEELAGWLDPPVAHGERDNDLPSTLRSRLQGMPPVDRHTLWEVQQKAVQKLDASLAANRPRSLFRWPPGAARPTPPSRRPTG